MLDAVFLQTLDHERSDRDMVGRPVFTLKIGTLFADFAGFLYSLFFFFGFFWFDRCRILVLVMLDTVFEQEAGFAFGTSVPLESSFEDKLEMFASKDGLLQTEMCDPHNLTPLTPSFQFSDHRKDSSKSRFSTRRCLLSPESNITCFPPYGKSPVSENSHSHALLLKDVKNIEDISSHQDLDYSNGEAIDEFSLGYDGLLDSCDLTVIIVSAGLAAVPFVLRLDNKRHWLHLALVVLVSAYPCALILSTPVATFCTLSKQTTSGLLIKGR
ncbi:hypothetical protein RHSIM_RhsimUnG0081600 [Rhododendron simsii]|uniref:Uncharacterized protein n=1 Tax=Rhododendron simsii TaxID=118357 RepID=A0A834FW60_RHOSS|nr:hypothetical protein RHSIM_RhsimUnG0081600 [Rhododendron simsii]